MKIAKLDVDEESTVVLRDDKNKLDCIITKRTDRIKQFIKRTRGIKKCMILKIQL